MTAKNNNAAKHYSSIKKIYHENYLENISHKLRQEAKKEKENCS